MNKEGKEQEKIIIEGAVKGENGLRIKIISQCPVCNHIACIMEESTKPINFRPEHIELTYGSWEKILKAVCNICDKKETNKAALTQQLTA